jgi:hypothetical protein
MSDYPQTASIDAGLGITGFMAYHDLPDSRGPLIKPHSFSQSLRG